MRAIYSCHVIADKCCLSLVEISSTESERTIRVSKPGVREWEVVLPNWLTPSVGVLSPELLAVWGSTRLFLLPEDGRAMRVDFDEEVQAVFLVEGIPCIVGELSVFTFDTKDGSIVDRVEAGDTLGAAWWKGDCLFVEQAEGPPLVFRPRAGRLRHSPRRGSST